MKKFADNLEKRVAQALDNAQIKYVHESEGAELDFHLPDLDCYIEIKRFHTERVLNQLSRHESVILIQGEKAVSAFENLISKT